VKSSRIKRRRAGITAPALRKSGAVALRQWRRYRE
jgi:hypothetical protein